MTQSQPNVIAYATPAAYVDVFTPSDGRAKAALICIGLALASSLLITVAGLVITSLYDFEAMANQTPVPTAMWISLAALGVLGIFSFVAWICAAVFYCRWQHLAHRNLYALGQRPTYTPGWGVGYWFIPIMNLFRPYQVLRDIATLSDRNRVGFPALGAYWACWLLANILSNITGRLPDDAVTHAILVTVQLCAIALEIAAAVLLYKLIRFIVDGQREMSSNAAVVRPI